MPARTPTAIDPRKALANNNSPPSTTHRVVPLPCGGAHAPPVASARARERERESNGIPPGAGLRVPAIHYSPWSHEPEPRAGAPFTAPVRADESSAGPTARTGPTERLINTILHSPPKKSPPPTSPELPPPRRPPPAAPPGSTSPRFRRLHRRRGDPGLCEGRAAEALRRCRRRLKARRGRPWRAAAAHGGEWCNCSGAATSCRPRFMSRRSGCRTCARKEQVSRGSLVTDCGAFRFDPLRNWRCRMGGKHDLKARQPTAHAGGTHRHNKCTIPRKWRARHI